MALAQDETTRLIETIVNLRRSRAEHLPKDIFFGEQAWDLLLVLFLADAKGVRLTGYRALELIDGPVRAAQRWIKYLTHEQLIVGDGDGRLDDPLTLTPRGLHAIEHWAHDVRTSLQTRSQTHAAGRPLT